MSARHLIVFTLLIVTVATTAHAQGEFLRKGESGFGIAPQYASANPGATYGAAAGICMEGFVEFGLSYAYNDDSELTLFAPSMTIYIKGDGYSTAPGLALTVAYGLISGDAHVEKSEYPILEATGFINYAVSDNVLLQPSLSLSMSFDQPARSDRGQTTVFNGGVTMCLEHGKIARPFFGAGIGLPMVDDADQYFYALCGLVIAW